MKTSGGGPNVWPGYVAAVAGLGISLLLLIAVLGLGIFQIGASINEKIIQGFKPGIDGDKELIALAAEKTPADNRGEIKAGEVKTASVADTVNHAVALDVKNSEAGSVLAASGEKNRTTQNSADIILTETPGNKRSAVSNLAAKNTQQPLVNSKNKNEVDILFQFFDGIYKLNEQAKKMSSKIVEQNLIGYRVIISASASVDIESAYRIAYIRILAVRNYFLDSGYSRENIIINLTPVSTDASKQNEVRVKFVANDTSVAE